MVTSDDIDERRLHPRAAEIALVWFCRAVAIYCLGLGVSYWVRLIGFYEGTSWRFDLMPSYWQVASASLAVLFPFAGIGLWTLASWGPVIWLICAGAELVLYAGFADIQGLRWLVLASHCAIASAYCALRYALYRQRSRAEHH